MLSENLALVLNAFSLTLLPAIDAECPRVIQASARVCRDNLADILDRLREMERGGPGPLSRRLAAIAADLEKYQETGATFEPTAIREICAFLAEAALGARLLEDALIVRAPASMPGDNVVPLRRRPHPRPVPPPPDGGDAA